MNIEHENDLNAASSKYMVHFPGMMITIDLNLGGQQLQMGLFGPIFCRIFQWDPDTSWVGLSAMFSHVHPCSKLCELLGKN